MIFLLFCSNLNQMALMQLYQCFICYYLSWEIISVVVNRSLSNRERERGVGFCKLKNNAIEIRVLPLMASSSCWTNCQAIYLHGICSFRELHRVNTGPGKFVNSLKRSLNLTLERVLESEMPKCVWTLFQCLRKYILYHLLSVSLAV